MPRGTDDVVRDAGIDVTEDSDSEAREKLVEFLGERPNPGLMEAVRRMIGEARMREEGEKHRGRFFKDKLGRRHKRDPETGRFLKFR